MASVKISDNDLSWVEGYKKHEIKKKLLEIKLKNQLKIYFFLLCDLALLEKRTAVKIVSISKTSILTNFWKYRTMRRL